MIDWMALLDKLEKLNPKVQALIVFLSIALNVYQLDNNSNLQKKNDAFQTEKSEALKKCSDDCYDQIKINRDNDQRLINEISVNSNRRLDSVYRATSSKIRKYSNKIEALENSLNKKTK